ncbi:MAG TPA: hypothetical protein VGQ09_00405 [Chitinophagaceae bacterium]|jgi:hypothetical protein|nr:hypothetical protein [Chitinophagaceae bacterium]
MFNWQSKGKIFILLKIANIIALLFWIIYFVDGFLPTIQSVEIVKDFEEFKVGRYRSGVPYKKLITNKRNFTTYANENGFFITDTLELEVTQIFGLVLRYRQLSPPYPQTWIYHNASSHHRAIIILVTIVLSLLTACAIFINDMRIDAFKTICLFTITGTFIFYLSLVT